MESLARNDSQAKKYQPEKGSPEAILRNIDMLEAMTSQLVDIATEAGWVSSIQLASMCPGEFNPRTYFMNFDPILGIPPKKCEQFGKLMATTKKLHQKRPRQCDDSDKEDFMEEVNAVGRASDEEDTGGPSEPTKRSKKKVKKDKCKRRKQKETGDNSGQKKPSKKKMQKTKETAVTGSSQTVHPTTSSTGDSAAPITADMASTALASSTVEPKAPIPAETASTTAATAEPMAPVPADMAATVSASQTADPATSNTTNPMPTITVDTAATPSASRTADPATSNMPNLTASSTAISSPSIGIPQPITTSSASEPPMASNAVINTNDFDMTELGDPFKDFMDTEWESLDGTMPCASTDVDWGQLEMSHMDSSIASEHHDTKIRRHNVNSAHLALNQGQHTYMWQQPSISVLQLNWSYSAPSQNITNCHPFPSNNTSVNFPSQVRPADYNAFDLTNTLVPTKMNIQVPSANFSAFAVTNTPTNLPNQVTPAEMNMLGLERGPAEHAQNDNAFAVTNTPINPPYPPGMPAAEIEGKSANSPPVPMTDIEDVTAVPPHTSVLPVNDNPQQPLASHSQDGIQVPGTCEPTVQDEHPSSEKENVRPLRECQPQTHREVPQEVEEAESVLQSCDLGEEYMQCVDHWKEFEMSMTVKEVRIWHPLGHD
ncbi:hypothetical protein EV421DRAFT_1912394 [Armillaria borealis]|uniref:Uncharacterized protein n=1 Tax=Armillaria borealis TaxID=47425 RepID=A0AA39IWA4_9AGAR|nr:hypothetical protein EV421DRAFT_1912394 [Armillaria borealis]